MEPAHDDVTPDESPTAAPLTPAPGDQAAAILAHELRGPLAVVNGYLDLLARASDDHTREYALGAAQRAVARMDALIDDVLDSVGCAGAHYRALGAVDPAAVVLALTADVPYYRDRINVQGCAGTAVVGDELRLTRALSNVLDNALRFSPPDSVARVAIRESDGRVCVSVEDDGPGFPPDETDRLRRRFERLDRDAALPGYGIGLGVTVELIEEMGGEVVLGNRTGGRGALVELWLPAASSIP